MKKKQILSLLLAFVLCLGLLPVSAEAADKIVYRVGEKRILYSYGIESITTISLEINQTQRTAVATYTRSALKFNIDGHYDDNPDAQALYAKILANKSARQVFASAELANDGKHPATDFFLTQGTWETDPYIFKDGFRGIYYPCRIDVNRMDGNYINLSMWTHQDPTLTDTTDPGCDLESFYFTGDPAGPVVPKPTPEQPPEPPSGNNAITYTCYKDADDVSYDKPNQSWVKLQNNGTFEMQLIRSKSPKTARGTWENVGPTDKPEYVALKVLSDTQGFDQEYIFTYNSDGNLVSDKGNWGDVPKGSVFSVLDSSQGNSNNPTPPPAASTFSDVPHDAWYAQNVQAVAEMGLFSGKGDRRFAPNDKVTIAETMKLAAGLHAELTHGDYTFRQGTPWYAVYEEYLNEAGGFPAMWMYDYNSPATRDQFARMMEGVLHLLPEAEQNKNTVVDSAIPDVPNAADNSHIYGLYRAGILTGSDSSGNFQPNSTILRSEVAAIMHRFIDPAQRKSIELPGSGAAGNAVGDGDQTGFVPPSWSWEREGTEGYDRSVWTGGKYVREDGKAVLYIESSDSYDFFSYVLHTMADGGKSAFTSKDWTYGGTFAFANTDGSFADDLSNGVRMTWQGDGELTVDIDWIDTMEAMCTSPVGVYHLVREK